MAVIKSKIAKNNSIITFILLLLTKFLIADPNAAQGDMDIGQTIRATIPIYNIEKKIFPLSDKKLDAAIVEIVHAFGLTIWNNAASWNFKGLESSSFILLKDPMIL